MGVLENNHLVIRGLQLHKTQFAKVTDGNLFFSVIERVRVFFLNHRFFWVQSCHSHRVVTLTIEVACNI